MTTPSLRGRISWGWILDKKNDLFWYIGSALAGWLYVALILAAVTILPRPMEDAFGVIKIGGLHIPLTLELLVYGSWAFLLDAPHLWSTLARTFLDPEERALRRRELWISWAWFLLGPAAILAPHLVNWLLRPTGLALPAGVLGLGSIFFVIFFRLWAYYHVVRQHWGFFMLYKRKNADMQPAALKIDKWFFNVTLYAPLVLFMTSAFYDRTPGMPPLGLSKLAVGGLPIAATMNMIIWGLFTGAVLFYIGYQVRLWLQGHPLNGPKLLFLLLTVPLHLVSFNNPWLAAMIVPIVTVGHNLQYHRIVWMYGQNKYQGPHELGRFRAARTVFSRVWIYFGIGLLFTFALYRGPWIDWLQTTLGISLNQSIFSGIGMMAGLKDPSKFTLGQQIFGALLLGWAMQHYYLDAKIWRVSRDRNVAQQLRVD